MLFALAQERLGPVDILINNATGWLADTFAAQASDRHGRSLEPVSAATWERQFRVDAMGSALMISEFADAHIAPTGRCPGRPDAAGSPYNRHERRGGVHGGGKRTGGGIRQA